MTTASSCSLPDYAIRQTFDARLKESGQDLVATFESPHFVGWGLSGFEGTRDGDTVRFTINGDYMSREFAYSFVYLVNATTELGYTGTATGRMADSGIVATLNGTVLLYYWSGHKLFASCSAPDHRMELVRK